MIVVNVYAGLEHEFRGDVLIQVLRKSRCVPYFADQYTCVAHRSATGVKQPFGCIRGAAFGAQERGRHIKTGKVSRCGAH